MNDAEIEQTHDSSDRVAEKAPPTEADIESIILKARTDYGESINPYTFYGKKPIEVIPEDIKDFKEIKEIIEKSIVNFNAKRPPEEEQTVFTENKAIKKAKQSFVEGQLINKTAASGVTITRDEELKIRERFETLCNRGYFLKVGSPCGVIENSWTVDYYYIVNEKAFIKGEEIQDTLPIDKSEES
jgi:hypothetical protein